MFARPLIDSVYFACNGKVLRGEVPISALSRLGDLLSDSQGLLSYSVRGVMEDDRHMLEVEVQGMCHLRCQRCLGDLKYPVDTVSRLRIVPAEKIDEFDADDEVDCIEASSQLDVMELVESELLLGLPFAPKHPDGVCSPVAKGIEQSENPFSVLAGLTKKH